MVRVLATESQWTANQGSSGAGTHRNAVPVPFWENGSSKLGPARSAVVDPGAVEFRRLTASNFHGRRSRRLTSYAAHEFFLRRRRRI